MSRSSMAVASATIPAATSAAVLAFASSDPAFAAIEAHRRAWAKVEKVIGERCALEEELPPERCRSAIWRWGKEIHDGDDPRWIAVEEATCRAYEKVNAAEDAILEAEPTTVAGVAAILRYVREHDLRTGDNICGATVGVPGETDDEFSGFWRLIEGMAAALERIDAAQILGLPARA